MRKQELKDFVKQNHKDFGGTMNNQDIAKQAGVTNARISQIKGDLRKETLDKVSKMGQEMQPEAA